MTSEPMDAREAGDNRDNEAQPATREPVTRDAASREPLSRERVLRAGVALADEHGIDAVSMRRVGHELGVEAMSLYNHVANKDDLLTGMIDLVVEEMPPTSEDPDWRTALRETMLRARAVLMRHPWAPRVLHERSTLTHPIMLRFDAVVGILLRGGFSADLTHHALHVLGSRVLGFTQEMFNDSDPMSDDPDVAALMLKQMTAMYPNLGAMVSAAQHDDASILGDGCDDQYEFELTLDLILDGLDRLRHGEFHPPH